MTSFYNELTPALKEYYSSSARFEDHRISNLNIDLFNEYQFLFSCVEISTDILNDPPRNYFESIGFASFATDFNVLFRSQQSQFLLNPLIQLDLAISSEPTAPTRYDLTLAWDSAGYGHLTLEIKASIEWTQHLLSEMNSDVTEILLNATISDECDYFIQGGRLPRELYWDTIVYQF